MRLTEKLCVILLLLFALVSTSSAAGQHKDTSILSLRYKALMRGKQLGWAKATMTDAGEKKEVNITMVIQGRVLGIPFRLMSQSQVEYNSRYRCIYFNIHHRKPGSRAHIMGKREGGGFKIIRKKNGKSQDILIEESRYDVLSVEPALWSGSVGSRKKLRVLFAGQGKISTATISIISRKKQFIFGKKMEVTHFKIKSRFGMVEEWRADRLIVVKSRIKTPIGTIFIEPTKHQSL